MNDLKPFFFLSTLRYFLLFLQINAGRINHPYCFANARPLPLLSKDDFSAFFITPTLITLDRGEYRTR